jgi:hypothetical protein
MKEMVMRTLSFDNFVLRTALFAALFLTMPFFVIGRPGSNTSTPVPERASAKPSSVAAPVNLDLQTRIFSNEDPSNLRQAGYRVDVSGATAVVGAPREWNTNGNLAGAVYVYVRTGVGADSVWMQQARLIASDGQEGDYFGFSVSIDGDSIVIGAQTDDGSIGVDEGSAYVFVRNGTVWTEQAKLTALDAGSFDLFGTSVSISGDTLAVSAPDKSLHIKGAGDQEVLIESSDTGGLRWSLQASDGAAGGRFEIVDRTLGTNRLTILSNGNVGIGTTGPVDKLQVNGIISVITLGAAGATALCRNASNQIATCSSSLRYKSNIESYLSGTEILDRLRPVTFNWKDGGMLDLGLVAEEVAEIDPLLVTYNTKGQVEGVKYNRIGVVLVNVVKEQQSLLQIQSEKLKMQSEELKVQSSQLKVQSERIGRLEGELAALRALVCASNASAPVCASVYEPKEDSTKSP